MLWQLAVTPWRWLPMPACVWGIDCDTGEWLQLADFDQQRWYVQPLSWVTPWGVLIILHAPNKPRRWLWLQRGWLGDAAFRRLARFLLRWRQYGRLGFRE
ncbi:protein YgfX [Pseudidiomarina sp.]|uniref:protein YgfX n=1 Tax=Pseudidiomarina sp. TaxID=2081707 RepID=UPI003A96F47D